MTDTLMNEFFGSGRLNGHAVKSPAKIDELTQLAIELATLERKVDALRLGIVEAIDTMTSPANIAKMAKVVLGRQGYQVKFATKDQKIAGDSHSPMSAFFGVGLKSLGRKLSMKQWLALVELLGPDQALIFKTENGLVAESDA